MILALAPVQVNAVAYVPDLVVTEATTGGGVIVDEADLVGTDGFILL